MSAERLPEGALRRRADPAELGFATTAELEPLPALLGQARALEAIDFGVRMRGEGYNLFVLGPTGIGKRGLTRRVLGGRAAADPTPADWVYVHNFDEPLQPRALCLPPGQGPVLRRDMAELVDELGEALPALFEGEEYRARLQTLKAGFAQSEEARLATLRERARAVGIALLETDEGFTLVALQDGEPMPDSAFEALPPARRRALEISLADLRAALETELDAQPQQRRAYRERLRALKAGMARRVVEPRIGELRARYADCPGLPVYLDAVQADVLGHVDDFLPQEEDRIEPSRSHRYRVNVLVSRVPGCGAPLVFEDHPLHQSLLGRLEYLVEAGNLVTDFTLIRPGALHLANGGYLILEAAQLLGHPDAWDGLKRALRSAAIRVLAPGEVYGQVSTVSLDPEPIPLRLKVLLLGDAGLYELLCEQDPDFRALFKVCAPLEEDLPRTPESQRLYARLVATLVAGEGLKPFAAAAVARVIEEAARRAEDAERLSLHLGELVELLRETDFVAGEHGAAAVDAEAFTEALARRRRRRGLAGERVLEAIRRGTVLIDTAGCAIGQINGLAVFESGDARVGKPVRVTATARLGEGEVVDIEREAELGGPLHAKGVLILTSLLGARYAPDRPLSLRASLVLEQSYGPIEGDSASAAEFCALLSAIAEVPLRQSLAMTGSLNQHGRIQAIAAVNDKIEGFFAVCRQAGLDGSQGVVIPAANVQHLMLDPELVEAVATGRFHVYAVADVDEAIALLTGLEAGERGADGSFPLGSVNQRVEARLRTLALARQTGERRCGDDDADHRRQSRSAR